MENEYDLIVIGSGPGGYSAAIRGSQKGMKIALIERLRMGGTCLNHGCIPTKTLLNDAIRFASIQELPYLNGKVTLNLLEVLKRKDEIVQTLVAGIEAVMRNQGIQIFSGVATFTEPKTVLLKKKDGTENLLRGRRVIIATGAKPVYQPEVIPDGEMIAGTEDALMWTDIPETVAVIGAGIRGVEFATLFQCFGSQVTLIERKNMVLPREDVEISSRIKRLIGKRMKVMTGAEVVKIERFGKGVRLSVETKKGNEDLTFHRILLTGHRKADVKGLGVERIGLPLHDGFIPVQATQETIIPGIYAVGDVTGGILSAHKALAEGVSAISSINNMPQPVTHHLLPHCVFTDPEIGSVGLTQQQAEEREGPDQIAVGKFPFEASGRAVTIGQNRGVVKIISNKKYGEVLGVHVIGPQATEIISLAAMAMKHELGLEEIQSVFYGHPTLSEAFQEAALDVSGEAIHFFKSV